MVQPPPLLPMQLTWMLDSVHEAVVWIDETGLILWCNCAFAKLVQVAREQVLGCDLISVLPLVPSTVAIASSHPSVGLSPGLCHKSGLSPFVIRALDSYNLDSSALKSCDLAPRLANSNEATTCSPDHSPGHRSGHWQQEPVNSLVALLQSQTIGRRVVAVQQQDRCVWLMMAWQWFERSAGEPGGLINFQMTSPDVYTKATKEELLLSHALSHGREESESEILDKPACLPRSDFYDPLTGLLNRKGLLERLADLIQTRQVDESLTFQLLCFDLDRFKRINDSLGYDAGDRLLIAIVQRIAPHLISGMTFARLDGAEFALLFESREEPLNDRIMTAWVNQLQVLFQQPFTIDAQPLFMTASVGSVSHGHEYGHGEDLLRDVDMAMHQAKSMGVGQHQVFQTIMRRHVRERLQLETDIHYATDRQELVVYYQPIMSLRSGALESFEALLRWQHPKRGLISPDSFIPITEENGLIVPIGLQVLQQACQQLQSWKDQFPEAENLSIGVNVSAKQMSQSDLVRHVQDILTHVGLAPQRLCLEITESAVMENVEAAIDILHGLKSLGIQLALDDFGTGYSSLGYLHRFPIDTIKLDRSFIQNIDTDAEKIEITRMLITLAWNIGLDVIAEGVEKGTQLSQLQALQCERAQGYFFSKPVPAAIAQAFLCKN